MMHCRCCFLLLLTLFAATVISQDGDDQCLDAARALAANQLCADATEYLNDAIESNTTISMETLYGYCTPSCRTLNRRLLSACANLTTDTTQLYCTVHEGVSCYDVVATFADEILDAQIECAIESPTDSAQTCSPRCMMVVQNFINAGGCCYVETLAFVDQLASNGTSADSVGGILSACPDFNNRIENTCQVINGSMTGPGDQGEDNTNQCTNATTALAANQPCFDAVGVISELGNSSNTTISAETLNAYCTPSCRALNNGVLSACADLNVDGTLLYCTVHEGVSCYDVATTFTDGMQDGVLAAQIACAVENLTDPTQTCSPGCMMAVQNFINAGGCCFLESLEFADQFTGPNSTSADIIRTILSACPGDIKQLENTCQVINGSMTGPGDQGEDNTNQCTNATTALAANQPCLDAGRVISELGNSSNATISMETLNAYCTPSCRALNNRVLSACADLNVDGTLLYCTVHEGVSCYDVVTTFTDGMQDEILEAQIACAITSPTDPAQTCSPGCMMAVQNFINAGGCCFLESLEIADQFSPNGTSTDSVRGILSACPGDINRIDNTCQVINGSMTGPRDQGEGMRSAGLVVSGNILLIGAIIIMASLLVLNSL